MRTVSIPKALSSSGNWLSLPKFLQLFSDCQRGQGTIAEINYTLELIIIRPASDPVNEIYSLLEAVVDGTACQLKTGDSVQYGLSRERHNMAMWLRRIPNEYH